MDLRRTAMFIAINALVAAAVTLFILSMWESRQTAEPAAAPTSNAQATPLPQPGPSTTSAPLATTQPFASSPSPTTTPGGPFVYVIQSGDTLGSLSVQFDVPLEDILAANDLTEDAILSIGQEIIIPVGGAVEPAATPASSPGTPEASPSGATNVIIFEITSPGVLAEESLVLVNLGERVNLANWTLTDGQGNRYTFPDVTVFADAQIKLHTTAGTSAPSDLYWGQSQARWGETGTVAYLRDAGGKLIATYRVP